MHSLTFRDTNYDIENTALQDDCMGLLSLEIDIVTAVIEDTPSLGLGWFSGGLGDGKSVNAVDST